MTDQNEYLTAFRRILCNMIHHMTNAPLTESVSHNFIVQILAHHRAAVEMSQNFLRFGPHPSMQAAAGQIIRGQTAEIAELERLLPSCGSLRNSPRCLCLCQIRTNQAMETMFAEMTCAQEDENISVTFLREMLPHHEGGIRMSEIALRCSLCPELTPLLKSSILSEQQSVHRMRQLLQEAETA